MKSIKFHAQRLPFGNGIELHMARLDGKALHVAEPVVLRKAEPDQLQAPFAAIDLAAAQQLMDELWQCGLRPSEGTGSAGSLAATQRHLDDMRRLVFEGKQ